MYQRVEGNRTFLFHQHPHPVDSQESVTMLYQIFSKLTKAYGQAKRRDVKVIAYYVPATDDAGAAMAFFDQSVVGFDSVGRVHNTIFGLLWFYGSQPETEL
ncbi:hypothetical protein TWF173_003844 [Orbilia oligospora]|uniref:Uncharacterized protein n=1 Tax=Arthrobotrys oligospora (strain ATCC 24927 / CBS 115.81 / DSM 1491) TaxID=756982 RepID=G1X9A8_ARTOA|nr:hypothetical protein AOL_s00076g215 [Orbilia oligospora ATCC 24927]EGX50250.1 hypothetical protein AOL_s00076g215 [Orbilia oligospora ATCC 24927]KAF3315299.1 hypothetical protein TWF173_003844 [Orbilia oligospora]